MANCELLAGCPFFNNRLQYMPSLSRVYKSSFCKGDNSRCARHIVFRALGEEKIPVNLGPNQYDKALSMVR
jgi:hypothetical protein